MENYSVNVPELRVQTYVVQTELKENRRSHLINIKQES